MEKKNSETKKQDGIPEDVEVSPEDRLSRLESNVDEIKGMLIKLTTKEDEEVVEEPPMDERMKKKSDDEEEESSEDKSKKQEDEEKPDEEKKKEEDEEDKKKADLPENINNNEDVKLPQAPAGETDEDAPPEAGTEEFLEKTKKIVKSQMNDVLKAYGFTKSSTPRTDAYKEDVKKAKKADEFALDILKGVRSGKLDQAGITRKIKDMKKRALDSGLKSVLEGD